MPAFQVVLGAGVIQLALTRIDTVSSVALVIHSVPAPVTELGS